MTDTPLPTDDDGDDDDTPALFELAIGEAAIAPDFAAFRTTLEDTLREDPHGLEFDSEDEPAIAACLIGRAIWNMTPRPANDFRPERVPEPGRNERCVIGLDCKVKQCCGARPKPPALGADYIWQVLCDQLEIDDIATALERKRVPRQVAPLAASILVDEDPRLARGVLETLYAGPLHDCDEFDGMQLMQLCDAYDALGEPAQETALIDRMIESRSLDLQADGWQRRASMLSDAGEHAPAWTAFAAAQRAIPDDMGLGPLELSLLVAEGKIEAAKTRANVLREELVRDGLAEEFEHLIAFYDAATLDPVAAVNPPDEPDQATAADRRPGRIS